MHGSVVFVCFFVAGVLGACEAPKNCPPPPDCASMASVPLELFTIQSERTYEKGCPGCPEQYCVRTSCPYAPSKCPMEVPVICSIPAVETVTWDTPPYRETYHACPSCKSTMCPCPMGFTGCPAVRCAGATEFVEVSGGREDKYGCLLGGCAYAGCVDKACPLKPSDCPQVSRDQAWTNCAHGSSFPSLEVPISTDNGKTCAGCPKWTCQVCPQPGCIGPVCSRTDEVKVSAKNYDSKGCEMCPDMLCVPKPCDPPTGCKDLICPAGQKLYKSKRYHAGGANGCPACDYQECIPERCPAVDLTVCAPAAACEYKHALGIKENYVGGCPVCPTISCCAPFPAGPIACPSRACGPFEYHEISLFDSNGCHSPCEVHSCKKCELQSCPSTMPACDTSGDFPVTLTIPSIKDDKGCITECARVQCQPLGCPAMLSCQNEKARCEKSERMLKEDTNGCVTCFNKCLDECPQLDCPTVLCGDGMRPFEVPQVFNGCPSCPLVMCEPDTCNFPADSCGARPPLNGTECPFGQTPFYPLSSDANACRKCHIQQCRGPCPDLDCSAAKCSPTEVARTTPQLNEATGCPLCPLHVCCPNLKLECTEPTCDTPFLPMDSNGCPTGCPTCPSVCADAALKTLCGSLEVECEAGKTLVAPRDGNGCLTACPKCVRATTESSSVTCKPTPMSCTAEDKSCSDGKVWMEDKDSDGCVTECGCKIKATCSFEVECKACPNNGERIGRQTDNDGCVIKCGSCPDVPCETDCNKMLQDCTDGISEAFDDNGCCIGTCSNGMQIVLAQMTLVFSFFAWLI